MVGAALLTTATTTLNSKLPFSRVVAPLARCALRLPVVVSLSVLTAQRVQRRRRLRESSGLTVSQKRAALDMMRSIVGRLPSARALGGETIGTDTYRRFISVCNWDPV